MNYSEFFRAVTTFLLSKKYRIALAGGFVASYYRKSPRATNDLDILFFAGEDHVQEAEKIISHFGLTPHLLRKADLEGGPLFAIKRRSTPVYIVAGRTKNSENFSIGLDLLLPTLPWAQSALERAVHNKIDFGFGLIPCLTVEDILISKIYALKNQPTRFMDLDDIKSIFESDHSLNLAYIANQMKTLELHFPKEVHPFLPKALKY